MQEYNRQFSTSASKYHIGKQQKIYLTSRLSQQKAETGGDFVRRAPDDSPQNKKKLIKRNSLDRDRRENISGLFFVTPTLILVAVFFLTPLVLNALLAFTNWSGFSSQIKYVGLQNFRYMIQRGLLYKPIILTFTYAVTVMVLQNATGLLLALALEKTNRINGLFRTVFFIPVLVSPLAAGYIWRGLLDPSGPVNRLLGMILSTEIDTAWLGIPNLAIFIVAGIDAWKWFGFATLVYIAGLNTIPPELMESATVDGSGSLQTFWHIKRPMLAPSFTYNITVTLIGAMSAFDTVMASTQGGPGDSTRVLNVIMYQQFGNGLFGFATAATFTITVMVILTAFLLVWYLRSKEVEM